MTAEDTIRLRIPRQDLDQSSYFGNSLDEVSSWLSTLPMANLGQSTRQIYQAISELNRVRMLPNARLDMLELLRGAVYQVSQGLNKHYLNQPIVLPEQARKIAELAHTLHLQLATGYTIVATHTAALGKRSGQNRPESLIAKAIFRAITEHTLNMRRHFQLYQPVKHNVWSTLHQLYLLAKQHKLMDHSIEDTKCGDGSIQNNYLRALLIGCCQPNQLRQEDFHCLFKLLTGWANLCYLQPVSDATLFAINPEDDKPPVYSELYQADINPLWIGLNTLKLTHRLKELRDTANPAADKIVIQNQSFSRDLLNHLILSWSTVSRRNYMRLENNDTLDLCIGLSSAHHFVSGELSFEALVEKRGAKTYTMQQENPFLKTPPPIRRQKDVWDSPYQSNVGDTKVALESIEFNMRNNEARMGNDTEKSKYTSHDVAIINSSAHGYCVAWPEGVEAQIKTGEIVGIKESHSHNWNIACIRWVSHESSQKTQLGLELISPSAAPYGARIIHKKGQPTEFTRVLILPEVTTTKQPVTILTPKVPFRTGMKVILNQRAKEVQIQLGRKVNTSGAYNQFEFSRISTTLSATKEDKPSSEDENLDDFDSIWGNL